MSVHPSASTSSKAVPPTRSRARSSDAIPALPLGTAVYDADVQHRAQRVAAEVVDAFPDIEQHVERLTDILARALEEQDRASRADEVLRRFSPTVRNYVRRHASST